MTFKIRYAIKKESNDPCSVFLNTMSFITLESRQRKHPEKLRNFLSHKSKENSYINQLFICVFAAHTQTTKNECIVVMMLGEETFTNSTEASKVNNCGYRKSYNKKDE